MSEIKVAEGHMLTFQDFEKAADKAVFILDAIRRHKSSLTYRIARTADLYDRQQNKTINEYVKKLYTMDGGKVADFTASNNRIASNFFNRLNTQRNMYSLGAGISFVNPGGNDATDRSGEDTTKAFFGKGFDHDIQTLAYKGLIHGVSFGFWNLDRLHVFPVTEFVPLWDENDGSLRAGARFWRLDSNRPMNVVLYEEDGYTKFVSSGDDANLALNVTKEKTAYILKTQYVPADGTEEVIGEANYSKLPIVPFYGSKLKQSTLVGMRQAIDAYDLIRSGFANDLTDCAEIYWIVENAGGMDDSDLSRFVDRLKLRHAAVVDSDSGGKATPYTQDIPYQARKEFLDSIRSGIYEDFGALDVHTVAAGATNDHIDAAYQPLDENASDFEYQVSEFIQQILELNGIEDEPVFHRTRISNQKEQVDMVMAEAQYLDKRTILSKLPNVTPEEVEQIMANEEQNEIDRMLSASQDE